MKYTGACYLVDISGNPKILLILEGPMFSFLFTLFIYFFNQRKSQ